MAVCSAPDFLLGVREALYADSYIYGIENKCSAIPMWVHQTETMKQLFMTAFSSFGGVIYCISCIRFRKKIKLLLGRTPRVPNNSLAEENENEISCTNEKIPLEILSNDQLKVQAENMALYPRSPSSAAML